jgi:PmbA protein
MRSDEELLAVARAAVEQALALGADEAEVMVASGRELRVDIQKDDILNASSCEETVYGIRVLTNGSLGFATVNDETRLAAACEEALALARTSKPDPLNGFRKPAPMPSFSRRLDPGICELTIGTLVDLSADILERVKKRDPRVVTDSGHVFATQSSCALASSSGLAVRDSSAAAGGSLFGMAVDGEEVGSFDYDGQTVVDRAELVPEFEAAADRFVIKTLSALGGGKGESFRGPVILSPEVVCDFVIGNLLTALDGKSIRTGKSPLAGRLGERVASETLTLIDDPHLPSGVASRAFDREGTPTQPTRILDAGTLCRILYDVYEARAAGMEPTGHARGGASSLPSIGPSNLRLEPGDQTFAALCVSAPRAVVVSRFSGSCNPITGEFSGVVKGGFLMRGGERHPIKETLIAGNLYELLQRVSGISSEIRTIGGRHRIPGIRVEDVSVTAG